MPASLDYLLPQPPFELTSDKQAAFESLSESTLPGGWVDYQLEYPKWQFLSYLCETRPLVLHGSQNLNIKQVEPRQAQDVRAYSNQKAIYATTDGIWAIFFAIVDRMNIKPLSLFNSCLYIHPEGGSMMGPLYFFSITHAALLERPWCEGAVYILPRLGFEQEPPQTLAGAEIQFPHWVSASPASPIARLRVSPNDFPFLAQVHGHNEERLLEQMTADPDGFPWPAAILA